MMKDFIIRRLKKSDYNDVLELEKQVHKNHYLHRPDIYNDVSELFPKDYFYSIIQNKNSIAIGIECANKIVAVLLAEIKETSDISIIKKRRFCYIEDIVVDKNYRRKGLAKELFDDLKLRLKKINVQDIELVVWPFNKEAINFYESLGMSAKNIRYELKSNVVVNIENVEIKATQNIN